MGAPALFILDGQVGELAAQLSSDGVVAIERTPPEGDLAVLYIDCSIGQVGLTLCFQPMARYGREGWHIISFARGEGGRAEVLSLFEKLWDRLKDIGAREDLPSDLAPN